MVEFDIFYRDPTKYLSPLRFSLYDWQKIETIRDGRYEKEKLKVQQDDLALLRENMVFHIKKKVTTNSKYNSIFVSYNFFTHLLKFPIWL